jgi:hypothetical protein
MSDSHAERESKAQDSERVPSVTPALREALDTLADSPPGGRGTYGRDLSDAIDKYQKLREEAYKREEHVSFGGVLAQLSPRYCALLIEFMIPNRDADQRGKALEVVLDKDKMLESAYRGGYPNEVGDQRKLEGLKKGLEKIGADQSRSPGEAVMRDALGQSLTRAVSRLESGEPTAQGFQALETYRQLAPKLTGKKLSDPPASSFMRR